MEAPYIEELETKNEEIIDIVEPEVKVAHIGTSKDKIVCQKKRGGFDLNDTNVTALKGALLVTSSVEVVRGGLIEARQIREMLLEIIRGI